MPAKSPRIRNKKARYNYHLGETIEAGLVLEGSEVKALREGKCNLDEAFARIEDGEVRLYNMHIGPNDLIALDLIGWDVVPEPATVGLLLLGGLFILRRRTA